MFLFVVKNISFFLFKVKKNSYQLVFFLERYDYVGKLLKPGEAPTNYSDEEEEGSQQESQEIKNDEEPKSKDD